jgi:uncharacterized protein YjeT (DUF2065 family)
MKELPMRASWFLALSIVVLVAGIVAVLHPDRTRRSDARLALAAVGRSFTRH